MLRLARGEELEVLLGEGVGGRLMFAFVLFFTRFSSFLGLGKQASQCVQPKNGENTSGLGAPRRGENSGEGEVYEP